MKAGRKWDAELQIQIESPEVLARAWRLDGSSGNPDVTATTEAVCTIFQDLGAVGSVAAGSQNAAFALAGGLAPVPGNRLELVAPATQDTTLAGLAFTLIGTRS